MVITCVITHTSPRIIPDAPPSAAQSAYDSLLSKGWSLRAAAARLGVHFGHLHKVLQGERASRRLIAAILSLPPKTRP